MARDDGLRIEKVVRIEQPELLEGCDPIHTCGMADDSLSSVQRAIAILEALGSEPARRRDSLGVMAIARLVGREKSQVSRTLKLLADAGLVERDAETLGYRLGWRLFTLAAGAGDQRLLATAYAPLRQLVSGLGERAHLSVLQGDTALTVISESPMKSVQAAGWIGRTTPLHCTSTGRALLQDHSDDEIREMFANVDFSAGLPKAPRDPSDALARIRAAARRGHAVVDEEFEEGLVAIAVAVRDFRGRVVGAVNISAPRFRLRGRIDEACRHVRAAADSVAEAMGYRAQPGPAISRTSAAGAETAASIQSYRQRRTP